MGMNYDSSDSENLVFRHIWLYILKRKNNNTHKKKEQLQHY